MTLEEYIENLKSRASKYDYLAVPKEQAEEIVTYLEVYKKALEIACWDTMCNCLHDDYYNDLLQKAREQE